MEMYDQETLGSMFSNTLVGLFLCGCVISIQPRNPPLINASFLVSRGPITCNLIFLDINKKGIMGPLQDQVKLYFSFFLSIPTIASLT